MGRGNIILNEDKLNTRKKRGRVVTPEKTKWDNKGECHFRNKNGNISLRKRKRRYVY